MAVIHDAYRFNCETYAKAVLRHLERAQARPETAYHLLRTAGMEVVQGSKWVQQLLDSYGGWDETAIDRELPQTWAGNPADIAFWLSILLYGHLQLLKPASFDGFHNLWRSAEEIFDCPGWDRADRRLLVRGHDFGVFFDRYVKHDQQNGVATPEVRSYFELIQPASASASAGWLDSSEIVCFQRRVVAEKTHLESKAKKADEREAIQRAIDMLSAAAAQETAICLIVSG